MPKVLVVYMGEAVLPTDPIHNILNNLLRVVIVLFWQHDDQLKSELSWMEIHILPLATYQ